MKKIFRWTIYLLVIMSLVLAASSVFAAGTQVGGYTLLEPDVLKLGSDGKAPANFLDYANKIYGALLIIAVALAIVEIVIGGFEYLTSAVSSKMEDGKKRINNALIGLAIALFSYLALLTINPDLVKWKLTIPQLGTTPPTSAGDLNDTLKRYRELNGLPSL